MLRSLRFRAAFVALFALAIGAATPAFADNGTIRLTIYKAGWIIGGTGGTGTLTFHGKRYSLGIGGLSIGLTFGGKKANLSGTVSHISRPSDVAGVYGAASAGGAVLHGASSVVLTNEKGAVLELDGRSVGLMIDLDLSGLALTLK